MGKTAYEARGELLWDKRAILPHLVLKARHLGGSVLHQFIGMPNQALGWLPINFGSIVEDEASVLYICACLSTE